MRADHCQVRSRLALGIGRTVRLVLAQQGPQHAVDQPRRATMSIAPGQFNRFIHRGPGRRPLHPQALVGAQPQDIPDPGRQGIERPMTHVLQQPIDAPLPAHHTVDAFRNKSPVAALQPALPQSLAQCHIRIGVLCVDGVQHFQSRLARRGCGGSRGYRERWISQNNPLAGDDTLAQKLAPPYGGGWPVASLGAVRAADRRRQPARHPQ